MVVTPASRSLFLSILSFVATGHFHSLAIRKITSSKLSSGFFSTLTSLHLLAKSSADNACLRIFTDLLFERLSSSSIVVDKIMGSNRPIRASNSSNTSILNWNGMNRKFESRITLIITHLFANLIDIRWPANGNWNIDHGRTVCQKALLNSRG